MTAETDLLPIPMEAFSPAAEPAERRAAIRAYTRANLAELQREVEGLRAEVVEAEKVLRGALDASTDGEPLRVLAIRASNALYWRTERAERAEARAERLAGALRESKETMLSQVKWEACGCGCPQGRKPADAVSVTWLRAVQQVEVATARVEEGK